MTEADNKSDEVERLLKKARPAEPSAELKARITSAARDAWNELPAEIPWRTGLRRLAISAAAAVLMVSSANYFSVRSVARWQAGPRTAARMTAADFEDMPETPYGPFVQHLIAVRQSSGRERAALLHYMERWQQALHAAQQEDQTEEPDAIERRSRLGPVVSDVEWRA